MSLSRRSIVLSSALAAAAVAACYTGPSIEPMTSEPATTLPTQQNQLSVGLPCDVATLFVQHCSSCHGAPASGGAKTTLTARESLLSDFEGQTLAAAALERMHDTASPMPPEGLLSKEDLATLSAWIDQGMPEGTCAGLEGAEVEMKCSSKTYWKRGGNSSMTPGRACLSCHSRGQSMMDDDDDDDEDELDDSAPVYTAAGTIYPTLHEPDDCNGIKGSGVTVVITGADGVKQTLEVNGVGNFHTKKKIALPYTASVVRGTKSRTMKTPQEDGDCNRCHSAKGLDAPGRILGP